MISNSQFRECIIRPSLQPLNLWCADSEELLVGTMAHESLGGKYLVQVGQDWKNNKGAVSIYQMEFATFKAALKKGMQLNMIFKQSFLDMIHDLQFATIMARINYMRFADPLPKSNDLDAIYNYYKKYWNSYMGSATKDAFVKNYHNFVGNK